MIAPDWLIELITSCPLTNCPTNELLENMRFFRPTTIDDVVIFMIRDVKFCCRGFQTSIELTCIIRNKRFVHFLSLLKAFIHVAYISTEVTVTS